LHFGYVHGQVGVGHDEPTVPSCALDSCISYHWFLIRKSYFANAFMARLLCPFTPSYFMIVFISVMSCSSVRSNSCRALTCFLFTRQTVAGVPELLSHWSKAATLQTEPEQRSTLRAHALPTVPARPGSRRLSVPGKTRPLRRGAGSCDCRGIFGTEALGGRGTRYACAFRAARCSLVLRLCIPSKADERAGVHTRRTG